MLMVAICSRTSVRSVLNQVLDWKQELREHSKRQLINDDLKIALDAVSSVRILA